MKNESPSLNESSPAVVFARGPRVHLRPSSERDIPQVLAWLNEPTTRRFLTRVFPLGEAEEREFVASMRPGGKDVHLIIVRSETNEPIGCCGMHFIDWVARSAELGIFLGSEEDRGQGLGSEAFETLMRYGFEGLNLHRLTLTVFDFNDRARRAYERLGFTHEGTDRQGKFVEGRYIDVLRYGMLADEWFARAKSK